MSDDRKGEIEIIPPGESSRQEREDDFATSGVWISSGSGGMKMVRLGPFQSLLVGAGLHVANVATRRSPGNRLR